MTIDRVIRRRILLGLLIAASFGLLTAWYYREVDNGPLHRAQGSVADAAVPLSAAVQRVARPFRDLWEWGRGLANARDEAQRLQKINQQQRDRDRAPAAAARRQDRLPHAARLHQESALLGAAHGVHAARGRRDRAAGRAGRGARADRRGQRRGRCQERRRRRRHRPRPRGARRHHRARQRPQLGGDAAHEPRLRGRRLGARRARRTGSCDPAAIRARSSWTTCRSATRCRSTTSSRRAAGRIRRSASSRACRPGLPIGVATQVNDPGDALVKVIQVTPLVDLDAFSHVLVLTAQGGASP